MIPSIARPNEIGFKYHAGKSNVLDELSTQVSEDGNPILIF